MNYDKIWVKSFYLKVDSCHYLRPQISLLASKSQWALVEKARQEGDLIAIKINRVDERTSWLQTLRKADRLWTSFYQVWNTIKLYELLNKWIITPLLGNHTNWNFGFSRVFLGKSQRLARRLSNQISGFRIGKHQHFLNNG